MIVIQKGIAPPAYGGFRGRKYPFNDMEPGDSFLINGFPVERVKMAAYAYAKKHSHKFAVRKTDEGYRCWRIA